MNWDKENVVKAVHTAKSIAEALELLGFKNGGVSRTKLHRLISEYGLDTSHFGGRRTAVKSAFDDKSKLECVVASSNSIAEVIRKMDKVGSGASYKLVWSRINKFGISTNHFNSTPKVPQPKFKLADVLVEGSTYSRSALKIRLIKEGILEYKCTKCQNTGLWLGKKLGLQLEHKNGIHNDNRLENLELLCPNCHSQTDTFAGRNNKQQ